MPNPDQGTLDAPLSVNDAVANLAALFDERACRRLHGRPNETGPVQGYVELYHNYGNGLSCAMTRHSSATSGKPYSTFVQIFETDRSGHAVQGGRQDKDGGMFVEYAGPVRIYAKGTCVRAYGSMDHPDANSQYRPDRLAYSGAFCYAG